MWTTRPNVRPLKTTSGPEWNSVARGRHGCRWRFVRTPDSPTRRRARRRRPELRKEDTRRLLSHIQLLDVDPLVVKSTKLRLLLESIRHELVSFGPETPGKISREEMERLLDAGVKQGDALQGDWPWKQAPELVLTNPMVEDQGPIPRHGGWKPARKSSASDCATSPTTVNPASQPCEAT